MSDVKRTEAEVVAELAKRAAGEVRLVELKQGHLGEAEVLAAVVPVGQNLVDVKALLDPWLSEPRRKTGTAKMETLEGFIAHANRHKSEHSAIFGTLEPKPALTCVLDYHELREQGGAPRFGQHRTAYHFPLSDEWIAWTAQQGKLMEQATFAEFLETRVVDVMDPSKADDSIRAHLELIGCTFASPSKLIELSRGLTVHVGERLQQHVNLSSGESALSFVSAHQDERGAPLKVPGGFLIAIPCFRGGDRFQIAVRLRYRASGGTVSWFYELARASDVLQAAFDDACAEASSSTSLPFFAGSPE